MASLTHAEKDALIKELKEKLKEMKEVEKAVEVTAANLSAPALGVHKDSKGSYHLVKINYDVEQNLAAIEKVETLSSHDFAIALFQSKKYLVEKILEKARGSKYAK